MSEYTKIEWTERTWNPITGCDKISPGCKNCYAERMSEGNRGKRGNKYEFGFDLRLHEYVLSKPMHWSKPKLIFVNSMSDMFHKGVPDEFIQRIFSVMNRSKKHIFQILTKRSKRVLEMSDDLHWGPNIWMGVSVENTRFCSRIKNLVKTGAQIKFVSFEPLIEDIDMTHKEKALEQLDWIVVGGEKGPGARIMRKSWAENIYRFAKEYDIPFFFKQWGEFDYLGNKVGVNAAGRLWEGKLLEEMPFVEQTEVGFQESLF